MCSPSLIECRLRSTREVCGDAQARLARVLSRIIGAARRLAAVRLLRARHQRSQGQSERRGGRGKEFGLFEESAVVNDRSERDAVAPDPGFCLILPGRRRVYSTAVSVEVPIQGRHHVTT